MPLQAAVEALYIGDQKSLEKTPCESLEFTLEGIRGDKHAGFIKKADARNPEYKRGSPMRNDRQWSAVTPDELAEAARALGVERIDPAWLGANLSFSGIPDFTRLPKGTKLIFPSGAVLVVEAENMPCVGPGRVIAAHYPERKLPPNHFVKAAMHKRGLVGVVERAGVVRVGDTVTVEVYEAAAYPLLAG
ncbi:MAG: MOSC domain-containing protein [Chloroflexi bacterium]|nr:MOSC domain-containing protein [Chloroflexota bacterium]MCC6892215.1 MOSC domain-containing protein [Anaerolineae bacterium]